MENNGKKYVIQSKKNSQKIRPVTVFAFLTVVCLPFHTLTFGGVGLLMLIGIPLLVLSIPALLVLILPAFLAHIKRTLWDKATLLLLGFFAYNLLGYIWTPSFSAVSLYNYVKIVVIVICLYCQDYNRREKDFLLAGSVLSCLIVCWFMLTERNIGYTDRRMTIAIFGVEQDPNYLGYLFLVPMAVAVSQIINHQSVFVKVICTFLAVLILFCVMMTGSRGALLGLATIVVICVINRFKKMWAKIIFCIIMAFLVMFLYNFVLLLIPENIAARFSLQEVFESGGTGRADIWLNAFRVMMESPYKLLFGFGTGSSQYLLGGLATHNFVIQMLLELGIVGTTLFLKFLWIWCRRLARQDTMCLSIIMGCMAMAMTLSVNTIYYFWFAFMLGIVCSAAKQ